MIFSCQLGRLQRYDWWGKIWWGATRSSTVALSMYLCSSDVSGDQNATIYEQRHAFKFRVKLRKSGFKAVTMLKQAYGDETRCFASGRRSVETDHVKAPFFVSSNKDKLKGS